MNPDTRETQALVGASGSASCKRCRYGEQKENVWCRAPGMEEAGHADLQGIHHSFAEECDDYSPNASPSATPNTDGHHGS